MNNIDEINNKLFKLELDLNSLILCFNSMGKIKFSYEYNSIIDKINKLKNNKKRLTKLNTILNE
jgi:hypothetical protein